MPVDRRAVQELTSGPEGNKAAEQYAELLERCLLLEEQKNNACLERDKYLVRLRQICTHDCGGNWSNRGELRCRRCDTVMAASLPMSEQL